MKKLSMHLGLNEVDPDAYGGWQGWLAGCVNDARDESAQAARAGFAAQAVFNLDCTRMRLAELIGSAAGNLTDGDTFLLTYSGHGGRESSGALSGFTETLCLADGELADTELREFLSDFVQGVRVIVVLDSCHSGGMARGRTRNKPHFVKSRKPVAPGDFTTMNASGLLLAACTAAELAGDGDQNGAFTGSRLAVADRHNTDAMTWESWAHDVARYMAKNFPEQHPTVDYFGNETSWDIKVTA